MTTAWSLTEVSDAKQRLLNRVCATLLYGPRFYASADETQLAIRAEVAAVAEVDPEFVLKLALYARQDLNIRSTTNYLLALAALTPEFLNLLFQRQERLGEAQLQEVGALVAYNVAIAELQRATGTGLDANGIELVVVDAEGTPAGRATVE